MPLIQWNTHGVNVKPLKFAEFESDFEWELAVERVTVNIVCGLSSNEPHEKQFIRILKQVERELHEYLGLFST